MRAIASRSAFYRCIRFFVAVCLLVTGVFFFSPHDARALQTVPSKMNFQGRVTDSNGNIMPDGVYNMKFRLYAAATGGSSVWSEDRLVSASNGVTVKDGLFSVQLGSVTSLPTNLFASGALYFEIELPTPATATSSSPSWTEGAMTPRNQLATSAYAFNSETLDGLDSADFGQISANNTFTGTNTFRPSSSSTTGFLIKTGGGTDLFAADTSNNRVQIGSATADSTAVALVLDTKNTSGDPTGTNGAMYYNSSTNKFRCYQASIWTDCIGSSGSGTSTLQDAYNNSSSPATITTTAGKSVKIAAGAAPTADLFSIDNTANPTTTDNVNGIDVNYAGGAAAVEGAGIRVDSTPGTTSGGTWSGIRVVSNPNGPASGVTNYGIKLEGPTNASAGNNIGLRVASGFDIGVDVASGGLQLSSSSEPATPSQGNLRVYAKTNAGKTMLKTKGGSGLDTTLQPFFGSNRISLFQPTFGTNSITTSTTLGTAVSVNNYSTGTTAATVPIARSPASTNLFTTMKRVGVQTSTGSGTVGDLRLTTAQFLRGNASGVGGFYMVTRYGVGAYTSGARTFAGMSSSASALSSAEVSSNLNIIGVGCDTADTTMSFFYNDASGTASKISLGANYPCNTSNTDMYEVRLFSAPNGGTIYYSVARLNTTDFTEGSVTTDIPANTTLLTPHVYIGNNATAAAASVDVASIYVETDN